MSAKTVLAPRALTALPVATKVKAGGGLRRRPNSARTQCQNEGVRSGSQADAMSDTAEFGDFFFERSAFASQDKLLRGHDALDGCPNFSADGGVLHGEIELRHGIERGGNLRM